VTVLDLSGKITLGEGDALLKDKLHSLLHRGKKSVLLNLADVSYVDSAGLGALVSAYTTVTREGGSLKLVNVTKKLQDLLAITKLLTVFESFDGEAEALRSYKS
jgi:anti-sigma B factor antagonist